MTKVVDQSKVKVHYTGKLESGEVFDSSEGREPLAFTVGTGNMIPGFEKAVLGMSLEESKTVNIPPAEAYGERTDALIQEIPKSALPPDLQPEVGQQLVSKTPEGQDIPVVVTDVTNENITIDANHHLAGKNLVFDLKVVEIG
ncbi:MAG: peptidylprolyl isomerase [Bacteroidota bacterium]